MVLVEKTTGNFTESASESTTSSYIIAVDEQRRRFAGVPSSSPIEVDPLPGAAAVDPAVLRATIFRQLTGMEGLVGKDVVWTRSGSFIAGCTEVRLITWSTGLDQFTILDSSERTVDAVRHSPHARREPGGHEVEHQRMLST